jgi:hypothetical protein
VVKERKKDYKKKEPETPKVQGSKSQLTENKCALEFLLHPRDVEDEKREKDHVK